MEAQEQTKVSSFLTRLLPQIQVKPVIDQSQTVQSAAIIFITAVLLMLAYFSIKKVL